MRPSLLRAAAGLALPLLLLGLPRAVEASALLQDTARVRLDPGLEHLRGRASWTGSPGFSPALPVSLDEEPVELAVSHVTLLPGEVVTLTLPAGAVALYSGGTMARRTDRRFAYTAPEEPGIHAISVRGGDGETAGEAAGPEVRIVVLVAHPASEIRGGVLEGYRIGAYRQQPLRGDPAYLPPRGFVAVRPADQDIRVSPHFTLGEFLCKQAGNPRMLALSRALVVKLELILEALNQGRRRTDGLVIMSGYRTPFYNRAIGNTTDYSRHLWGDAADIYVDDDGNGDMDDLNGDGTRDIRDARYLQRVVQGVAERNPGAWRPGGLASYRRNPAHGPFVHVDARGYAARW